jgi:hypothetical protein
MAQKKALKDTIGIKAMKLRKLWPIFLFGLMLLCTSGASAYTNGTYGSSTYGSCSYGSACSISLTSNGNISLNVTPAPGGSCTIQSDSATVMTDDSNGYTLTLADSSTSTALMNGGATINSTSGTLGSPTPLTDNSWGYRVDGLGSFGNGPTTSQTNVSPGGTLFAGIEASNQLPDTIASSSGAADPAATTTVWFGACADTSIGSGAYTSQALYTAVAN